MPLGAVQDGGEDVRLIDADALKNNMFSYAAPEMVWDRGDIEYKIDKQPTIDAIPVEWLENRLNALFIEAMGAGGLYGDRIGELAKSINEVMKLWQREQEA